MNSEFLYLWQQPEWPNYHYEPSIIGELLANIRQQQLVLQNRLAQFGVPMLSDVEVETAITEVMKSSEIEGEYLNCDSVRSSVVNRLALDNHVAPLTQDKKVDGLVNVIVDATRNYHEPLTKERLCYWHQQLFPDGRSGLHEIEVGQYRTDLHGEMQIVSGALGRQKVHYVAPPGYSVDDEMERFIAWYNTDGNEDPHVKAAVAHLWFVLIHPFEDGNGRIGRAISDMQLSKAESQPLRYFSLSAVMQDKRKQYYQALGEVHGEMQDYTGWCSWYLNTVAEAIAVSHRTLDAVELRKNFWDRYRDVEFSPKQKKVMVRLLDGFEGYISFNKWKNMTHSTREETAADIHDLVRKGILQPIEPSGHTQYFRLGMIGHNKAEGVERPDPIEDSPSP
ncbi:Fic family protein [Neisseria sp. HSC-16F19]|nr:Fic family protein [Neisseria sp. HSC-16F19]MCP2041135.1 Fic family protein [Neisseria sp. HSC-16F19]